MGFWSALGKIGSVVAAPFTGGASLAALPAIGAIGQVAGKASAGAAAGRQSEAEMNLLRDRLALDAYNTGLKVPGIRAADAVRGSLLSQMGDVTASQANPRANIVNFSGGLRPSALMPEARQVGAAQVRQALLDQMSGVGPPKQAALPQPGFWEKFGGAVGLGGSLIGAAEPLLRRKKDTETE